MMTVCFLNILSFFLFKYLSFIVFDGIIKIEDYMPERRYRNDREIKKRSERIG